MFKFMICIKYILFFLYCGVTKKVIPLCFSSAILSQLYVANQFLKCHLESDKISWKAKDSPKT